MSLGKNLPPVICLMGPTASGKTDLAMRWCDNHHFSFEIISVDSVLIYKGMDIGSGKPSKSELLAYPHQLVDILEPHIPYSAGSFHQDVLPLIQKAIDNGKIPLLVGGTMLYFNTLFSGIDPLPTADPIIRAKLLEEALATSWQALHARLAEIDPIAAAKINPNDAQRIQRALEVFEITGLPLSSLWKGISPSLSLSSLSSASPLPFNLLKVALNPDRPVLHQRIEQRFMKMLDLGLVEETKTLLNLPGMHLDLPSMRSVGYRQVADYLAANVSYEDMVKSAIIATRQLAKRQVTWLRRWDDVVWCDPLEGSSVKKMEEELFLKLDN